MYSRNSFGSFYPVDSMIHKLNPVVKIINFVIMIILLILCDSLAINVFLLLLILIMMLLSFVPLRYYMDTFWSMRYLYIIIAFLCLYFDQTLEVCFMYMIKLICLVEYISLLAYTTSPSESAYGIEKFLSFFNFVKFPISKLSFKINSLLRYNPLKINVENKTFKIVSSRGFDYYYSNIISRFFLHVRVRGRVRKLIKRKNKEIAFCQELRLFNINKYRTNYRTNKVSFYDIFLLLFHLCLIYAYLVNGGFI